MASIRNLKQDINYVLGDIIEAALIHQAAHPDQDGKAADEIVDDSIKTFDDLMARVNNRKVDNRKAHLTQVRKDLETEGKKLIERVNGL
ncbi:MAG: hypothetical protein WBA16_08020 [Nonlabens sp.]